jgi:hypothetical protein
MTADVLPGLLPGVMTPAEREARWTLWVRFAIEAASYGEARAVTDDVLACLAPVDQGRVLPLRGQPAIQPLGLREGIWVATVEPDLTGLQSIEPDDAKTRGSYVSGHFGASVLWTCRVTGEQAKWEWPPDLWSRRPGTDDILLHHAVRAVTIWCEAH